MSKSYAALLHLLLMSEKSQGASKDCVLLSCVVNLSEVGHAVAKLFV